MSKANWMATAGILLLVAALVVGCNRNADRPAPSTVTNDDGHVEHNHPTEGPHGGSLIELGNEEYHAELVHDEETGTVTIYVLDAHAELVVPIDATELTINLKRDGQAEQFKLAASPTEGDAPGKSSRFVSSDSVLLDTLDRGGADSQLVVMINGKPYRGKIAHVHRE